MVWAIFMGLSLVECDKLTRLVGIRRVGFVHLEGCNQLENIDCLGDQQSLVILFCKRLQALMKADGDIGKYEKLFHSIPFLRIDVPEFTKYSSRRHSLQFPRLTNVLMDEL